MDIRNALNDVLTETYRDILRYEEKMMCKNRKNSLSIGEIHTIEAIGKFEDGTCTITDIAKELGITLATATVSIMRLEKKGYVLKKRGEIDKRQVFVTLTHRGNSINKVHKRFHMQMVDSIVADFTDEQKEILLIGIEKLNNFFQKKTEHQKN